MSTATYVSRPVSHSRFSPTPADSVAVATRHPTHIGQAAEKNTSHRQPKDSGSILEWFHSGIPVKLNFRKAVSCGEKAKTALLS